ncbi:hypothetical protein N7470_005615 [Penicillium chermesinum]|nr:hypothetical protein N7470_005615 [Penicillium chermesinum]
MGNSQSTSKNDRRRSNRLTKPLTTAPGRSEQEPALASGLIGWQNPWVGASAAKNIRPRPRKIPSTVFESDAEPQQQESEQNFPGPLSSHAISPATSGPPSRRSYQTASVKGSDRSSVPPEHPRRANSVQTPLQRQRSVINNDVREDAASSNTSSWWAINASRSPGDVPY